MKNADDVYIPLRAQAYYGGMYFVYILECEDASLYTGITNDLERRFKQHSKGAGARYTSAKRPIKVVYTEEHLDRSSALKREAEIKSWRRPKKLSLIHSGRPKA